MSLLNLRQKIGAGLSLTALVTLTSLIPYTKHNTQVLSNQTQVITELNQQANNLRADKNIPYSEREICLDNIDQETRRAETLTEKAIQNNEYAGNIFYGAAAFGLTGLLLLPPYKRKYSSCPEHA